MEPLTDHKYQQKLDGQQNLLEKEFILLQERADELADSLNRQNYEFTDERAKWSFEIREIGWSRSVTVSCADTNRYLTCRISQRFR